MSLLDFSFKLMLWFLLTADSSLVNIAIGVGVALLLPQFGSSQHRGAYTFSLLKVWLQMLGKIAIAIPQAYFEAFEMMLTPHNVEEVTVVQGEPRETAGLVFLDIFLITFTPKTIVLNYTTNGQYVVHSVRPRRPS